MGSSMDAEHDSKEREQLLREITALVDEVKAMTPENADECWKQFEPKLRDWNDRAGKHLATDS